MSDRPKITIRKKDETPQVEQEEIQKKRPESDLIQEDRIEPQEEDINVVENHTEEAEFIPPPPGTRLTYTEKIRLKEQAERAGVNYDPFAPPGEEMKTSETKPNNTEKAPPKKVVPSEQKKTKQPQPRKKPTYDNYNEFAPPIPWLKYSIITVVILGLLAAGYFFLWPLISSSDSGSVKETEMVENTKGEITTEGFYIRDMLPEGSDKLEDILSDNMSIRELLEKIQTPRSDINELERAANLFSVRRLKPGDKYTVAYEKDNPNNPMMLMIEPKFEPYNFYKFDLSNELTVDKLEKEVEMRENSISGIVEGTLGQTFIDNNLNLKLISGIEEVMAWTIDLFDVSDGDRFKVIFDEEYVNGRSYRIDKVKAILFQKDGKPYYAFYYDKGERGFFNEFGQSMKRNFLATPIKYGGVITSGFGLRTHPVTGHTKEHLGTDFAAPEGTPIQAVADGVITIATFKNNNGNYVKMRHDRIYETQYLHMQKFADGIVPGRNVRQGEVIGFVGSTGMSTGPHVCYRFWKNSEQVDPMEENMASGSKISPSAIQSYYSYIEPLRDKLDEISYF